MDKKKPHKKPPAQSKAEIKIPNEQKKDKLEKFPPEVLAKAIRKVLEKEDGT